MENRFQHAMMLFSGLGAQVTEWENTLPPEDARAKTEEAILRLSDADFEMIRDLIAMLETEPARRLFGPVDTSGFNRTLDDIALRRLPVN
jgi:hypothetical protein